MATLPLAMGYFCIKADISAIYFLMSKPCAFRYSSML